MRMETERCLYLPTLYRKTARGEIQVWRAWAEDGRVYTEYGLLNGKKQRTVGKASGPTNEGRSNSRDIYEQAKFEADAMWRNRIERRYRLSPEEVGTKPVLLPMLAQDFWMRKRQEPKLSPAAKKLPLPAFVQRKFNGVRCVARRAEEGLQLFSRQGKVWKVPHISEELRDLDTGIALDGEIYYHGYPLQKITSLAKDYREDSKVLEFHVYDLVDFENPEADQRSRFSTLDDALSNRALGSKVINVERHWAGTLFDIVEFERKFVEEGYEGAIIRATGGTYRWGVRSAHLLKYKSFEDAEFEVVDCREGKGKFEGCAIFVCRADPRDGETFKVAPRGTLEERREFWRDREQFIGRKLTVRFKGRTEDGIPFHPVGIAFRDRRDLP